MEMKRVLSIQSHVVHGHVGNKCATFPLQLLGFDVDFINSVQFSNHTGYSTFKGEVLGGNELWNLIEGLDANELLTGYSHLLTGYIGSSSFLRTILRTVLKLRTVNPSLIYVCDPVMGDNGKLYIPEELVAIYREEVVAAATVLTPNQFECELLTGMKILSEIDALKAMRALHEKGPEVVILTSLDYEPSKTSSTVPTIEMLASLRILIEEEGGEGGGERNFCKYVVYRVTMERMPGHYTGTGDLTAALLLAWTHENKSRKDLNSEAEQFRDSLEKVAASMQAVLRRTYKESENLEKSKIVKNVPPELRLIQSRDDLITPPVGDIASTGVVTIEAIESK
eukprot:g3509.t1